jgi:FeS assembly protein IscX
MEMIGARMTPINGEKYTMRWTDVQKIAIALEEKYPDCDNLNLRFTDLRQWVLGLEGFADHPDGCNEKILEAIQMAWIDERDA